MKIHSTMLVWQSAPCPLFYFLFFIFFKASKLVRHLKTIREKNAIFFYLVLQGVGCHWFMFLLFPNRLVLGFCCRKVVLLVLSHFSAWFAYPICSILHMLYWVATTHQCRTCTHPCCWSGGVIDATKISTNQAWLVQKLSPRRMELWESNQVLSNG